MRLRLDSLLALALAVLSGAYAACSPSPPLPSAFLADLSIKFSDPSVVTLSWTPANITGCDNSTENYVVVQANLTGQTLEPVYNDVLCNVSYAYSCNVSIPFLESLENSQGVIINFFVLLYYSSTASPVYDNSAYQFTFCSSAPPLPAQIISPVSGTIYLFPQSKFNTSYASITFDWQAGNPAAGDFGRDCSASPSYEALLVVSQDYNDLQQTSLSNISDFYYSNAFAAAVSSSYPLALDFGLGSANPLFSSAGVWYWRVMRTNSMYMVGSVTYNFTVQSYPDPCLPVCNPIGGVCNVSYPFVNGTCNCTSSYTGPTCSDLIPPTTGPTASLPPPGAPNLTGLIVGVVIAGVVVILTVIVVILYIWHERRKERKELETSLILIQPPEFAVLAWAPFNLVSDKKIDVAKKVAWTRFEQLILSQDFSFVFTVSSAAKVHQLDSLIASLVCVFAKHAAASSMVQALMLREIEQFDLALAGRDVTSDSSELANIPFRTDSPATRAFKVYSRVTGLPYLFDTLGQILNDFCALLDDEAKKQEDAIETASTHTADTSSLTNSKRATTFTSASMEVDPSRLNSAENETINRLNLQLICQKVFVKIYRSAASFPSELRSVCNTVRQDVLQRESLKQINVNVILSNLIFLRFINPAVLMPQNYGLVKDEPATNTTRQLVLITKVLQNLASGTEFGHKETYMVKLNPFIQQNSEKMANFLNELTGTPQDTTTTNNICSYVAPITEDQFQASLINIYRFVAQNFDTIAAMINQEVPPERAEKLRSSIQQCLSEIGSI